MIVAIHQPNYVPWLGYFAKIARADVVVLLDDAQFSKNSYINRVQIDAGGVPRWLTIPVSYRFGDPINHVREADKGWRQSHLDRLKAHYLSASAFPEIWSWFNDALREAPDRDIASANQALIEIVAAKLNLRCRFLRSSEINVGFATADSRLIAILQSFGGGVTYLSGKGGAKYQDPEKFAAADIPLVYSDFLLTPYKQGRDGFLAGLSVLDALFHLGCEGTAKLLTPAISKVTV